MENGNASSRNESPRPPLARDWGASLFNRFTLLSFRVAKSLRRACLLDCFSSLKKPVSKETALEKFTVFWGCSVFVEAGELGMEDLAEKAGGSLRDVDSEVECFRSDLVDDEERNGDNSSSDTSSSEEPQSSTGSEGSTRPDPQGWPMQKRSGSSLLGYDGLHYYDYDGEVVKFDPVASDGGGFMEVKMMKERFSKLLLGEDMSGCGTGACTALAISNAITNLCAAIFGQLRRLEPLSPEQKSIWQREMEWLLCVGNYVVELVPSRQTFPDGSNLDVMTCKQRSDLYINLPALQKLDNMLLEILDSFKDPEFWYIDEGRLAAERNGSCSFQRPSHLQQEKWWLPLPCVSPGGLNQEARKQVEHKRERASQILKAAMAINSNALAEMEIPESYLDSLPKSGRACLGDVIYRHLTRSQFSPERLLDCLVLASEHQALEIANGVEASIHVWRRTKVANPNTSYSWGVIKGMMFEPEKRELLADRAETLLLHLKQRLPGLAQTALDTSKIQFNKDVGKSILEGYSRVVESLAFKIFSSIEDLLHADDMAKCSDQLSAVGPASVLVHKRSPSADSVLASSTQIATPAFSPAPSVSPSRGGVSPFIKRRPRNRGFGVKRVVTEYLGVQKGS